MVTIQGIQQALDIIALLPIGAAFALFGCHMVNCWNRAGQVQVAQVALMPEQEDSDNLADEAEALTQQWAAMAMESAEATLTVEIKQEAISYDDMNITQLRKECKSLGICWKDAHGKGKHLKRAEILEAIAAI
jgi:hypothetical protein